MGITYKVELACQNSGLGYWDIIKRIQAVTNTRTQTALAEILEIRQSSIFDAKRRQSVPGAWYMTLFEKLGVNPDWLKSGIGPVYLRTEAGYIPGDGDGTPPAPGLLDSPLSQPALVTMYAMRGDDTGNGAAVATLRPAGSILLPRAYVTVRASARCICARDSRRRRRLVLAVASLTSTLKPWPRWQTPRAYAREGIVVLAVGRGCADAL